MQASETQIHMNFRTVALSVGVVMCALGTLAYAEPSVAPAATTPAVDSRMHPGEVRVLNLDPKNYKEVVPGKIYMRHWFGTNVSVAMFHLLPGRPPTAMHSHGTEFAVQMVGDTTMLDEAGRSYPLHEGDVMLVKAGAKHMGKEGNTTENLILSVVTPPRPEYPSEDGKAYFPGFGTPASAPASSLAGDQGAPVRVLFNLKEVTAQLNEIVPGQLYFKHWHGDDVSVGVTRMVRNEKGRFPRAKPNMHGEEVALLVKGSLTMKIGDKPYHIAEGEVLMIPPFMPHSGDCETKECLLISWFTPNRVDEWGPEGNDKPNLSFVGKGKE